MQAPAIPEENGRLLRQKSSYIIYKRKNNEDRRKEGRTMQEPIQKPYDVIPMGEKTWRIEDNGVRAYLFAGTGKALLTDTCFGRSGSLKALVESLTDRPVMVVNTHADGDHTGCNEEFGKVYMHPAEFAYYHAAKPGAPVEPVWEGDRIDIGGRAFEVIHIPGHTPGSIALLDRENRILVGGDSISLTPIFMFSDGRSMEAHRASLIKLLGMTDAFDVIYASHGDAEVPPEQIGKQIRAVDKILAGEVEGEEPPFPLPAKVFAFEGAAYFCSGEKQNV